MKKDTRYLYNKVQIQIPSGSTCVVLCGTQDSNPTVFAYKNFSNYKIINYEDFFDTCSCILTEFNAPIIALCSTEAFFKAIERSKNKLLVINMSAKQINDKFLDVLNENFQNLVLVTLNMVAPRDDFDIIYHLSGTSYINEATVNIE